MSKLRGAGKEAFKARQEVSVTTRPVSFPPGYVDTAYLRMFWRGMKAMSQSPGHNCSVSDAKDLLLCEGTTSQRSRGRTATKRSYESGCVHVLKAWLRRMHEAELKPDCRPRQTPQAPRGNRAAAIVVERSFNGVIASAAQLGQMDLAAKFLRQMLESSVQPNVMSLPGFPFTVIY